MSARETGLPGYGQGPKLQARTKSCLMRSGRPLSSAQWVVWDCGALLGLDPKGSRQPNGLPQDLRGAPLHQIAVHTRIFGGLLQPFIAVGRQLTTWTEGRVARTRR